MYNSKDENMEGDDTNINKKLITTMDIYETYFYMDEELALEDMKYYNLSSDEYEVAKYGFRCFEIKDTEEHADVVQVKDVLFQGYSSDNLARDVLKEVES